MQRFNKSNHSSLFLLTLIISLTSILSPSLAFAKSDEEKEEREILVAGWLERIILQPWGIKLRAKLDTGAKTSSLHVEDIERFERDGKEWVRFHTTDPDEKSQLKTIEAPLIRDVKIKRHKQKPQTRPVVEMTFCLDGNIYTSEFSLTDRGRFHYPVLLGRRLLQQGILVDPASTFTLATDRKSCGKLMQIEIAKEKEKEKEEGSKKGSESEEDPK